MILLPVALIVLMLAYEDRLAPYVQRAVDWLAGTQPLTVEQAHAARPDVPRARRPRRWGVRRVVDAEAQGWLS